ncbi:MAG: site-specific integrase [Candidatus Neomarinimicrobiota bacterium]
MRKYFTYLKEAEGLNERTIQTKERVLGNFEEFLGGKKLSRFNEKMAIRYKDHLKQQMWRGKMVSKKTVSDTLNTIRDSLKWLSQQPGYRTAINPSHIQYLRLTRGEMTAVRTTGDLKEAPTLEYVFSLMDSIGSDTEVGVRDKAVIAMSLMGGFRAESLTTMKLEDIDLVKLTVCLRPLRGSAVKYNKANIVFLMVFDKRLLKAVREWVEYLTEKKRFIPIDPVFPMTDVKNEPGTYSLSAKNVKPEFWKTTGSINKIFKDRAKAADLRYYHPHSFRRLHYSIARKYCSTMEELSAVSRNLGHSHIDVSDGYYGNFAPDNRIQILSKIRFDKTIDEGGESKMAGLENRMAGMDKKLDEIVNRLSQNNAEGRGDDHDED